MRKNAKIDKQALVECICYLLFAFALLYLVLSGQYLQYVTPRMKPYLLFAAVVLLVWARTAIENLYVVRHRRHCLHCFVLVFPLLMLILPHRSVSVSSVSTPAQSIAAVQTLRGSAAAANPTPQPTAAPSAPATAESSEPVESPETEEQPAATPQPDIADSAADAENIDGTYETTNFLGNTTTLHGYDAANRHITISDAEFYTWMDVIWANPADYDGWTLTVTGEVDKASREMDADEFIPARLIMTCCAADLTPCGFVCKWAQADTLATDTWVTVTGTLYQRQYADHSEPQLQVQSVAPAEPVEGYIYPYY